MSAQEGAKPCAWQLGSSEQHPWPCLRAVGSPAFWPGLYHHPLGDLRPWDANLSWKTRREPIALHGVLSTGNCSRWCLSYNQDGTLLSDKYQLCVCREELDVA